MIRIKRESGENPGQSRCCEAPFQHPENYFCHWFMVINREGFGMKEFRLEDTSAYEVGAEIKADVFAAGDKVDASGVSKGKGFQSTIKRYNAQRGPMGHGSKSHRVVGSMGSSATPSRVKKGKRMPGHMGSVKVTIQNLEIVRADAEKNLLLIKGAVPGPKGSVLVIKDSVKA